MAEITGSGEPTRAPGGRTRWGRVGAMLASSAVVGAVMFLLTAQGVLAAQFAISGFPFTVTSSKLTGTGFEQFGSLDSMAPNSPNANNCPSPQVNCGGSIIVVTSAINSAQLADICQSVSLGGFNLKITAGGSTPVKASTLLVDSTDLTGDATFTNINIGQDASTLTEVPGVTGILGIFAEQADSVQINNLRQTNWATTAATFSLPNLHLFFDSAAC